MSGSPIIVPFRPAFARAFHDLNLAWIERLFAVEPVDRQILDNPQAEILDRGGEIFFALIDGEPVGCCAAIHEGDGHWELSKMAVDPGFQGRGIGERLGRAVVEHVRKQHPRELYLVTNSSLTGAIRLYQRLGFVHRPLPADTGYVRGDVMMVYKRE